MKDFKHPKIPIIKCFDSIDSTMSLSEKNLQKYDKHSLIIACSQDNGRGRKGNNWVSPLGGLWFNLNLKHISQQKGFTLFLGYCIMKAINQLLQTQAFQIKWPNDIYLNNQKICGLICSQFPQHYTTLIGVGINTNITNPQSLNELNANSILLLTNKHIENEIYLSQIIDTILTELPLFEHKGLSHFLLYYQEHDYLHDKNICVTNPNSEICGVYQGINEDGALVLKQSNAETSIHYAGSILIKG